MNEAEPKYITELRNHIDDKIENTEPKYFKEFKIDIKKHVDLSINELAIMIKDTMVTKDDIQDMVTREDIRDMATKEDIKDMITKEDIRDMATKQDIKELHGHIGRYEVRAQNIEEILLQDHKPRIKDLEKEVFA